MGCVFVRQGRALHPGVFWGRGFFVSPEWGDAFEVHLDNRAAYPVSEKSELLSLTDVYGVVTRCSRH